MVSLKDVGFLLEGDSGTAVLTVVVRSRRRPRFESYMETSIFRESNDR